MQCGGARLCYYNKSPLRRLAIDMNRQECRQISCEGLARWESFTAWCITRFSTLRRSGQGSFGLTPVLRSARALDTIKHDAQASPVNPNENRYRIRRTLALPVYHVLTSARPV